MKFANHSLSLTCAVLLLSGEAAWALSSSTLTETVNKRLTIGSLTATPSSVLTETPSITFRYMLHTAGTPIPVAEKVRFFDGANRIGSPQLIESIGGSNLLPYSQVTPDNGWTFRGTAPKVSVKAGSGPDGSRKTATQISYPDTLSGNSGIQFSVPGTVYASHAMTLSVWARAISPAVLTLTLSDFSSVAASGSIDCAVTSTWRRCVFSYVLPSDAVAGFSAILGSVGHAHETISLWGAQVEQAAHAGPFVPTVGVQASGGQGGAVTFRCSRLHRGPHVITVAYAGDDNFVSSISNSVTVNIGRSAQSDMAATAPVSSFADEHRGALAFALDGSPHDDSGEAPGSGMHNLDDSVPLDGEEANSIEDPKLILVGSNSLTDEDRSITVLYAGDGEFTTVTSSPLAYTVAKISSTIATAVTSSSNPSTYGDKVTLSVLVTSSVGPTPAGTVSFVDGLTSLGTLTLDSSGVATMDVPTFTAGAHALTITYSPALQTTAMLSH